LSFDDDTPFQDKGIPAQLSSSYLATQLDIIRSRKVALRVVDLLQLENDPFVQESFLESGDADIGIRDWLASALMQNLTVEPLRESRVINLSFETTDAKRAAEIANSYAQAYIDTTLALSMDPAIRNAEWFDAQLEQLRQRLEQAQAKLTDYQQAKGIVALDERMGIENSRLGEISKGLVAAQKETYDARSRQLGENHPELKRARERERSSSIALENQKRKILELKQQRDEAEALAREVEFEQQNYEATLESYYQTRLKSQFNQTNIAILSLAIPPQKPASPNLVLNILSAIFLGLFLGFVLAFVIEMSNRRVRSADDVDEFLQLKVLGTV
jgi:uncharacterized protein involved in exopolysaccharide biosynthesis